MKLPTLYKVDSKGKVRIIILEIEDDNYRTISGVEGGAMTISKWTVASPKNAGKTNATTSQQQALKEATAKHTKKLTQHYYDSKDRAINDGRHFFEAMLAIDGDKTNLDELLNLNKSLLVDPKLDGMRLLVGLNFHLSRKGKNVPTARWIYEDLELFLKANPSIILDGELYNHDYNDSFEEFMSLARRTDLTKDNEENAKNFLQYHIYDMFDENNPNMTAEERKEWIKTAPLSGPRVRKVLGVQVFNREQLDLANDTNLALNYEGSIVRLPFASYKAGRSKNMIKIKEFKTAEFTIIDILPGQGNRSNIAGRVIVDVDGTTVGCSIKGSWKYCDKLLKDRWYYIGRDATIKYFNKTAEGSLRFPVCIDINRWNYE